MTAKAETLIFPTWRDIPAPIRSHCMERVSAGVYHHHRLGLVFVCADEANTAVGARVLVDEVAAKYQALAERDRVLFGR